GRTTFAGHRAAASSRDSRADRPASFLWRSLTMLARRTSTPKLVALLLFVVTVLALSEPVLAVERNFAGSAQLDYQFVPTAKEAKAFPGAFDGFTMELAAKVAVDFNDRVSANMKVCYGCHGFEADMMYFDVRIADE